MLNTAPVAAILPMTDPARAKEFYVRKLGLVQRHTPDTDTLMFEAGKGTILFLYKRAPVTVVHTQVGFSVADLEQTVSELRANGVVFEDYDLPGLKTVNGIADTGHEKSAWFKDSEGNILAVTQMRE
jgi:predicted enzyme related to lactoylglutathione lyase